MHPLTDALDLVDELDLSEGAIRYRINRLGIEKIYRLNKRLAIYTKDVPLVRDYKKPVENKNPIWVQDFIAEVKEEIEDREYSMNTISKRSGIPYHDVTGILNRGELLSLKNAEKLAKAIGMKVILCLGDSE